MSNVFNHGRVHVRREMCSTCIFRPHNLMYLNEGRVKEMVEQATEDDGVIPCHQTILGQAKQEEVCRGFFDKYKTPTLELAEAMGVINE